MRPQFRTLALAFCGWLVIALSVGRGAQWEQPVGMSANSGVRITLSAPFAEIPPSGCMPFRVTIENHSGATRRWQLQFRLNEGFGSPAIGSSTSAEFVVENGRTSRFDVLMPVATRTPGGHSYRSLVIMVNGPGVQQNDVHMPSASTAHGATSPFVLMSNALAPASFTLVKTEYDAAGSGNLVGSPVELRELPGDWRALSGASQLWLTEQEYLGLEAAQRMAIKDWVLQGGRLFFCTQDPANAPRADLGIPSGAEEGMPALGQVRLVRWDGKQLVTSEVVAAIRLVQTPAMQLLEGYSFDWAKRGGLGGLQFNTTLLAVLVCLFAALVGPVNLFYFAGAANRHRLFWTTPLISLAASLMLAVFILVADGTGGRGERVAVVHLVPTERKAVLLQEQAVRTSVLFGRNFSVGEDIVLSPIALTGTRAPKRSGSFTMNGRHFHGDWFASRSLHAHLAQAIIPTRAEVQVLNEKEISETTPPVVLSSIAAPLRWLIFTDKAGRYWIAENVQTGQRATLRRISAREVADKDVRFTDEFAAGSVILNALLVWERPGAFYAQSDAGPYIETLPSIRWGKQHTIYMGPASYPAP